MARSESEEEEEAPPPMDFGGVADKRIAENLREVPRVNILPLCTASITFIECAIFMSRPSLLCLTLTASDSLELEDFAI